MGPRNKVKRLVALIPSLIRRMGKRTAKNIVRHRLDLGSSDDPSSGDEDTEPRTEPHRHVAYSVTPDNVSRRTTYVPLPVDAPQKRARLSPLPFDDAYTPADDDNVDPQEDLDLNYLYNRIEHLANDSAPRKRAAGDRPLLVWRGKVQEYLDELMRLEGHGDFTSSTCPQCAGDISLADDMGYRCEDCDDCALYCAACTKTRHVKDPLHRVHKWTGTHYEKVTLKSLGVRIQLGHRPGDVCYNPVPASMDGFVVLDLHGVHEVGLSFCACESAMPSIVQLLRHRLYPATSTDPRTAATFCLLETFHLLSGQSKISAFEFYSTLARKSDNTGTQPPRDRYPAFLHMMRQWRYLKMLKRGGRGNVPGGAFNVPEGSCAVECPACPHPGKNLPDDWNIAPAERSWLYKLYLAIDANFRLKRKNVSTDAVDPDLNAGCAYFVEESAYKAHLTTWDTDNPKEPGECNTHDAIKLANIKGAAGLAATGLATVDCSRHDMKRPCSMGDLQKGKRQVNIDYLLNSTLSHNAPTLISISYDVACIYCARQPIRWTKYGYDTFTNRLVTWSVPMFHLNAHRERCRSVFSPYLLLCSARLNGEGVERRWAMSNGYVPSTREMGPGSRRDVLDDVFGDQNWAKVTKLASTLLTRIKVAVVERVKHVPAFKAFTRSLPADAVEEWTEMVTAWDLAPRTAPNPYEYHRSHVSVPAVRLELAEEDAADIREGRAAALHESYSSSTLLVVGMEIEDQQRKLTEDVESLGAHPTDLQRAKLLERQNALQRRIDGWRTIQLLFMPAITTLLAQPVRVDASPLPQKLPLYLPSSACTQVVIPRLLLEQEWRLRLAQAFDALTDLRGHLEVRAYIYHYKDQQVRGQREGLRSRDIVNGIDNKIKMDKLRYRAAYSALTTLAAALTKYDWRGTLQPLHEADIRHISAEDGSGSEGRKEISWIWKAGGTDDNLTSERASANLQEGLRVEWCKARARAMRWTEEVELLQEEMRRTQEYHSWCAMWWEKFVNQQLHRRAGYKEGMDAYAYRQAAIRRRMRDYCKNAWTYVRAWVCLGQDSSDDSSAAAVGDTGTVSSVDALQAAMQDGMGLTDAADAELALEDFD